MQVVRNRCGQLRFCQASTWRFFPNLKPQSNQQEPDSSPWLEETGECPVETHARKKLASDSRFVITDRINILEYTVPEDLYFYVWFFIPYSRLADVFTYGLFSNFTVRKYQLRITLLVASRWTTDFEKLFYIIIKTCGYICGQIKRTI